MAEASGSEPPRANQKYFCYKCTQELSHVLEDFTCPLCKGGFIEAVADAPTANSTGNTSHNSSSASVDGGHSHGHGGFDFLNLLRGISDPFGGGASVRFQSGGTPTGQFQRTRSEGSSTPTPTTGPNFSFVFENRQGGGGGRGAGGQQGTDAANPDNPMEHMLFTFLNDLIHGLGGGAAVGGAPILSNFGDYAWGRDGLDTIVTQLMNQMEGTGPPPLAHEKIDTLPDIKITQEQFDRKLQCSVCWDDFKVGDSVKKLECDHVYHPDCIIPWLKLHGTCPICRKDLTGQITEDTTNPSPAVRFEPMNVDEDMDMAPPNSSNSNLANTRTSAGNSSNSSGPFSSPGHVLGSSGRNLPSNPVTPLLNLLDPFIGLTGATGATTNTSNTNSQPNTGHQQGTNQSQPPENSGRSFDNMDFEFD